MDGKCYRDRIIQNTRRQYTENITMLPINSLSKCKTRFQFEKKKKKKRNGTVSCVLFRFPMTKILKTVSPKTVQQSLQRKHTAEVWRRRRRSGGEWGRKGFRREYSPERTCPHLQSLTPLACIHAWRVCFTGQPNNLQKNKTKWDRQNEKAAKTEDKKETRITRI